MLLFTKRAALLSKDTTFMSDPSYSLVYCPCLVDKLQCHYARCWDVPISIRPPYVSHDIVFCPSLDLQFGSP